jgi:hypothetical protein
MVNGENSEFYANLMLFLTNLWWAFHVRQATEVEFIPILFISFAIGRPKLSEDQEIITDKVSKPLEQRFGH